MSKLSKLSKKGKFKKPKKFKPAGDKGAIMGHKEGEPALAAADKPEPVNRSEKTKAPEDSLKNVTLDTLQKHSADKAFKPLYDILIAGEQTRSTTIAFPHTIQEMIHELYLHIWNTEKRKCSAKEIICNAIICSYKDYSVDGVSTSQEQKNILKGGAVAGSTFTFPFLMQDMLNDIYHATWQVFKRKTNNKEIICMAVINLHKTILS